MTIECYYSLCSYHSANFHGEGPFCDEPECRATREQLEKWGKVWVKVWNVVRMLSNIKNIDSYSEGLRDGCDQGAAHGFYVSDVNQIIEDAIKILEELLSHGPM